MIEIKTFNGGLNLDDSPYRLPPNDYIDALNITHDAFEGSNDQAITNIESNRVGDATYVYPEGVKKCIGAYANTLRNTIIQFIWISTGHHLILEFDLTTRLHTKIFENLEDSDGVDVLGFTEENYITSINIYNREEGDLLYFLDSLGRPTQVDISLFKAGFYTPVTRAILDKGKKPPLSPPSVIFDNDTSRLSNNFRNKLMRYKYRWIYDDFEKSTFSPISTVPLPVNILNDVYANVVTNNNVVRMSADTGDKNVKSIEIAMSYVEKTNTWSDFQSIAVIEKASLSLQQTTQVVIGSLSTDLGATTFSGLPIEGEVVNIYLTELPNNKTLIGTYTVQAGDTLNDIATGVLADLVSKGIAITPFANENSVVYIWDKSLYSFNSVEIVPSPTATINNRSFPFSFYNDSTYPNVDIEESIQLFDYVPDRANAQEMPNGNILVYAGITEGYDKNTKGESVITVNTVAANSSPNIGSLYAVVTDFGPAIGYTAKFGGIPATGTIINVRAKNLSTDEIVDVVTYTTIAGDTIFTIPEKIVLASPGDDILQVTVLGPSILGITETTEQYSFNDIEIVPPTEDSFFNSIATWQWSTERSIARAYFDEKGKTNGILYTDKVTFPAYAENGDQEPLLPYINYKVYDVPPEWAYSMQFYMNKDAFKSIFWVSIDVNKDETEYIYFDISTFTTNASKKPSTASVLNYSYKEGDRMRVIRNTDDPGIVFDNEYDTIIEGVVTDPVINTVPKTGTFLKIKNIEPFTTGIDATKDYVIEIYSPAQQVANASNQVYYEFGEQYDIIDPGKSTRRHSGEVQNQVVGVTPAEYNFYEGDSYFRTRTIAVSDTGYATFNVMDRNFVDFYISAVSSIDGRPSLIDLNARRAYYSTMIRFGQAYQANTNINGLNRFYGKNFDEYDYSYGDIMRLKVRDRQLRVFQKLKIGSVPLYSSIGKDGSGLQVVFDTDKLLNPIIYYAGNFGIGTLSESLSSNNFADYGCDNIKGVIWRVSADGITPISILYKVNSWATRNLPQVSGSAKVIGGFNQKLNDYILSIYQPTCIPVVAPVVELPDGLVGAPYSHEVFVTGTPPFELSEVVKPSWMDITTNGYKLIFSGTPDVEGVDIPVSFSIANTCGSAVASESLTFNVIEMQAGTILLWGGQPDNIPTNSLVCNGAAISRVTYANLFAAVGTTYGTGDGSTTFNLPNAGKKIVAGFDAGDISYGTVGATGGDNSVTITDQQIAHNHVYQSYTFGAGGVEGDGGPNDFGYVPVDTSDVGDASEPRDPVDVRNEFIVFPYIIIF